MNTIFIRGQKTDNYTRICNTPIKDQRLSWKARGILVYLLSLPDDWKINLVDLENRSDNDSSTSLTSGIRELEQLGYFIKHKIRAKDGKFIRTEYEIVEEPKEMALINPPVGFPLVDNPQVENEVLLITNNNKELIDTNIKEDKLLMINETNELIKCFPIITPIDKKTYAIKRLRTNKDLLLIMSNKQMTFTQAISSIRKLASKLDEKNERFKWSPLLDSPSGFLNNFQKVISNYNASIGKTNYTTPTISEEEQRKRQLDLINNF